MPPRPAGGEGHGSGLAVAVGRTDACRNVRSQNDRPVGISQHDRRSRDEHSRRHASAARCRRSPPSPTRWPSSARSPTPTAATRGGTHFVMTGYDNRMVDNGGVPSRPGYGSILSRVRGASHRRDRHSDLRADGRDSGGRRPGVSRPGICPVRSGRPGPQEHGAVAAGRAHRRPAESARLARCDQSPARFVRGARRHEEVRAAGLQPGARHVGRGLRHPQGKPRHRQALWRGPRRADADGPPLVRGGLRLRHDLVRRLGHARQHRAEHDSSAARSSTRRSRRSSRTFTSAAWPSGSCSSSPANSAARRASTRTAAATTGPRSARWPWPAAA